MKEFLSVCEVASILKLNELTIRRYLKSKQLKGFKVGRFWRIKETELDRFIEKNDSEIRNGGN